MSDWLVVALFLAVAVLLGGCWMVFLKGERPGGYCKLCIVGSAAIYLASSKNWLGLDLLILSVLAEIAGSTNDFHLEGAVGTVIMAVTIFLPVFGFVHFLAWLVRRWDRKRYSRRLQYLHGSRFLPMYFPNKGSSDGAWQEAGSADLDAGDCDAGDFGGDIGAGDVGGAAGGVD